MPPPGADGTESHAAVYLRGKAALDRDDLALAVRELKRAVDLASENFDYQATLAWAQFRRAEDKEAVAGDVRQALTRAILKANEPDTARFYLGRVERILGRDREALRHFQIVLENQPRNQEAAAEIRFLEHRLHAPTKR
jgi:cytochrome c-type biogenesis protein CcmH/NrfG